MRLIEHRSRLVKFINDRIEPKLFEQKKFSEVYTPLDKIEEMLDLLPNSLWKNPKTTWYDPAAGMGNFCVCVYYRLMDGLKTHITADQKRSDYIIKNMLFMSELNTDNAEIIVHIFGKTVNLYVGDSLSKINVFSNKHFTVIMGNPPYYSDMAYQGKRPLYNLFIEKYIDMCMYMVFVVPSRWFAGGQGLDKFRKNMLSRMDIKIINHIDDAREWFGKAVNIKGGINYFLKDSNFNSDTVMFNGAPYKLSEFDVLVKPDNVDFIAKIIHIIKSKNLSVLSDIYKSTGIFKVQTNDKRFKSKGKVVCYVSERQSKSRILFLTTFDFTSENTFWKVITPAATQGSHSGFGFKKILSPYEIHSKSYISFKVKNKKEAESLLSYLNCDFPNKLLAVRKITQQINNTTCSWIPLLPLDRIWTDKKIITFLKL